MSKANPQVFHSSTDYPSSSSWTSNPYDDGHLTIREDERLERMAGRMIEQAMTAVVVRKCWNCQRRFVKNVGCSEVVCLCGASTCYRCGDRMEQLHRCRLWLPPPNWGSIRRAAWTAKRHLRLRYPALRFKYDPSRRLSRRSQRRRNRRNRVATS